MHVLPHLYYKQIGCFGQQKVIRFFCVQSQLSRLVYKPQLPNLNLVDFTCKTQALMILPPSDIVILSEEKNPEIHFTQLLTVLSAKH